jgi:leucyl-tRNA synthetase
MPDTVDPKPYAPKSIEPKWQSRWESERLFKAEPNPAKPKFYVLDMFPYPSGAGLHVGHPEGYTATDILCRMKRMQGFNVLHPMGWDAFGLPAENHAIATGQHPRDVTKKNVDNFRRQIKALGFSYDWDREVDTTDPAYYKWTQWIFLQLFKKGLAYESVAPINFCPSCRTGLANEEVHDGACERCGTKVERKPLRQWILKITAYADRLLEDLKDLDWPESTLAMQRNWIGRSEGAEVVFAGPNGADVTVFTTRPDTLFGATYMVLSPEHALVEKFTTPAQSAAVKAYQDATKAKSDLERTDLAKDKTGVFTGGYAVNPVNGEKTPVWIADYVLSTYGTGAIMAVPAHDGRDYAFAQKFGIPIKQVVAPADGSKPEGLFEDDGVAVNSGPYDGKPTAEVKKLITAELEKKGKGKKAVNYRLRDWVFSRQRYWGEPIPLVHCPKDGIVPVPENELPVRLPEVEKYLPTGTGESPLAAVDAWVNTKCPKCSGPAKRETNTMPQWAGSCWYYLRYIDPTNDKAPWDKAAENYWMGPTGVDLYVGGAEHAVLHLLYSRFWHKVLFDLGLVTAREPYKKLRHQGMILSFSYQDKMGAHHSYDEIDFSGKPKLKSTGEELKEQVEKMSKSKKNVVSPDDVIGQYGADTMRLYEMFMGDFEASKPWDMRSIEGIFRFLGRVWRAGAASADVPADKNVKLRHKTIQAVTERTESFKFNTAIASLMEYVNALSGGAAQEDRAALALLISPFAPHLAEELWELLGHKTSIALEKWPVADPSLLKESDVELPIQINGKVKERVRVPLDASQDQILAAAKALPKVAEALKGQEMIKQIVIPGKMVSFVLKPSAVAK